MENPNNGGNDPRAMGRAEWSRNARAMIEEKRQMAMHNRQRFEPVVREQIQRLFRDYEAPFYARIRGFGKAQTLTLAESTVSSLAAANNRSFSDSETQALTEHFVSSIHAMLVWKWTMTGLAVYMTYRGRNTWRFPFFKPKMDGRWNPVTGGPRVKIMWHSARFAAYYGACWLLGEPVFQGANFMRYRAAMEQDPRLTAMLRDGKARAQEIFDQHIPNNQSGNSENQYGDGWKPESQSERFGGESGSESGSITAQAQPAWGSYRQQQEPQSSPRRDSWEAVSHDIDDASPQAPAMSQQGGHSPESHQGSAWDRIRQQSQYKPRQDRPPGQQSWQTPRATGGWGDDDDSSPQARSSQDSYLSDENHGAKSQAQREFDEMLERERRGTAQEQGSWPRR
ncbi:hypothetical protein DCS_07015 [Drechmeria coniospora]|uniref:Uncharacterized protein n=1 Tax=Drechmeria coniospora TaxID=98403 RepID=A0A151GDB0_DRECN|nr:hypothetical protein DCS_07015 [Drechmeria coniospora]KYK55054.1 hypothetical protein DCS_07015 [Drechmeria coniospora]